MVNWAFGDKCNVDIVSLSECQVSALRVRCNYSEMVYILAATIGMLRLC